MSSAVATGLDKSELNLLWENYVSDVRARAEGDWFRILGILAPALEDALSRPGRNVPCPSHGGKDGFRLKKDSHRHGAGGCNTCGFKPNGFHLLMWINNWRFGTAVREVGDTVGLEWEGARKEGLQRARPAPKKEFAAPQRMTLANFKPTPADLRVLRGVRQLLDRGKPIEWVKDYAPTRYFGLRGLGEICKDPPQDLLYVPDLEYYRQIDVLDSNGKPLKKEGQIVTKAELVDKLPAILCLVRNLEGEVVGVHRIWFTQEGAKPFKDLPPEVREKMPTKKLVMMPHNLSISGAAIRLYNANGTVGVGEGVETVLGARLLMVARQQGRRIPVWAGISTSGLGAMEFPDYISEIYIFADNDKVPANKVHLGIGPGEEASWKLRNRVLDRGGARIFLPPRVDTDWNDVYVTFKERQARISQHFRAAFLTSEQLAEYERAEAAKAEAESKLAAEKSAKEEAARAQEEALSPTAELERQIRDMDREPDDEQVDPGPEIQIDEASVARQAVAPWERPFPPVESAPENPPSRGEPEITPQIDPEWEAQMAMANAAAQPEEVPDNEITSEQAGVPANWELLDRQFVTGKPHYRIIPDPVVSLEMKMG